jgi:ATP-dependent Clp protease, protease subunit
MNLTALSLIVAGLVTLTVTVESLRTSATTATPAEKTVEATTLPITISNKVSPVLKLKELSLASSRQVYITGEIESNAAQIAKQILILGRSAEPMTIIINSPGGSVIDGAEIISAIEAAKGPVNTLCVELCASMAAMIHSYGTNRLMLNRSIVMFHPASGGLEGEMDKMYSRISILKRYVGKMELNVAKRAHISYEQYKALSGVELWLDAEDAVNSGFADQVVFVRGADSEKLYQVGAPEEMRSNKVIPRVLPVDPIKLPVFSPKTPRFYWY